jgi:hypothetical protein
MLIEYTYVMEYTSHSKDKKGKEESETRVFEVYIPTLKDGANTRGVLIMTSRNGVPVPPEKMEKVRSEAGKDLEKEENRIAKQKITDPAISLPPVVGMKPLGMYPRMTATGFAGFKRRGVTLDVHTVLQQATFTYLGREDIDGRENLIFSFAPNPQGSFDPFEGYVARLKGKALDRCEGPNRDTPRRLANLGTGFNLRTKRYSVAPAGSLREDDPTTRWQLDAERKSRHGFGVSGPV